MRKARGVDEVFIPIRLQVRPHQFRVESGRETGGDQYLSREVRFSSAFPIKSRTDS